MLGGCGSLLGAIVLPLSHEVSAKRDNVAASKVEIVLFKVLSSVSLHALAKYASCLQRDNPFCLRKNHVVLLSEKIVTEFFKYVTPFNFTADKDMIMGFWTAWNIGPTATALAAVALAFILSAPLSRAAYRLPRVLDTCIPSDPSRSHKRYRAGFWVAAPILALVCAWRFGATPATAAAIVYVIILLALAWIDAETGFLPDLLTISLLWLGLLVNLGGTFSMLADAVVGAAAGYLALWVICGFFLLLTGRQGMGHGDFKLLAALGAWLGWAPLPWIVLIASLLALTIVLLQRIAGRMKAGEPFSFGPYLAIAGIAALLRL